MQTRGGWLLQVNKSVLVKGRLSTDSVSASVAMKSWWNPSSTAAVSATYPFGAYNPYPKLGLTFGCENFGNIRFAIPTRAASELLTDNPLPVLFHAHQYHVIGLATCRGVHGVYAQLLVKKALCWWTSGLLAMLVLGVVNTLRVLQV